jgi:hypothetical protein
MRFDKIVEELLEKNTIEEDWKDWKRKLAIGVTAAKLFTGDADATEPTETQRRIAAAEAISKGETPKSRYKDSDQSPEAKKYRSNMKKIEAAQRLSQGG